MKIEKIIWIEEISWRKLCIHCKCYWERVRAWITGLLYSTPHIKNSAPFPSDPYSSPVLKEMETVVFLWLLYYLGFVKILEKCKMLPGSAATHWNYAFLCAWFMQHLCGYISWSELFSKIFVKCTVRIFFLLCIACGHCNSGWIRTYSGHQNKLPKSNPTGKIVCSTCKSFRYLWDLFPLSNFITALTSGLSQLVTMVDNNNDIISYSKHMCFHPKGSRRALPICVAITITPWLWNSYLKALGNVCVSMKKGTAWCSFEIVV